MKRCLMHCLTFWRLCSLLGCLGFGAAAQTTAPAQPWGTNSDFGARVLSLAQAKEVAFQRNWDLLAAKSGVDAATAQLLIAKEFPNPTASLSIAKIGTHAGSTSMGNGIGDRNYDSIAAVSQLMEIAGKRKNRQAAGRADVIGAKARFYDAKRTLDQGVTKAYIAALLAGENVRILNQSSALLLREAAIAAERNKAGDLSDSDMKQIQINAEQYELQAKSAEAAAVQARIGVEILMGERAPKGDWTPAESLDRLVADWTPPLPGTNSQAARPDVLAAEADLRGGKAQLQLQRALRIPDPTLTIGVEHNPPGNGPPVDTFLMGLSFPLPLWNLNRGNIQAAQAGVAQFEQALGKARTQAMADIASAQVEYDEASARWTRYRDVTAPKSAQVLKSVQFAYDKGGAALLALLDAERTDNDIRLATVQAMSDTTSAIADLVAARNVLLETELMERDK